MQNVSGSVERVAGSAAAELDDILATLTLDVPVHARVSALRDRLRNIERHGSLEEWRQRIEVAESVEEMGDVAIELLALVESRRLVEFLKDALQGRVDLDELPADVPGWALFVIGMLLPKLARLRSRS